MKIKILKSLFYIILIMLLVCFEIFIFKNHTYNYLLTNKAIAKFFKKQHIEYIDTNIDLNDNFNTIIDNNFDNLIFKNIFAIKKEVFVYSLINKSGLYQKKWIRSDTEYYKNFTYINNVIKINNLEYNIDKVLIDNYFKFKDISKIIESNYIIYREEIEIKEKKQLNVSSNDALDNFVYSVSTNKEFYDNKFNIINGFLYNGDNIKTPEIGDIKIIYKTIEYPVNFKFVGFIKNNKLIPIVLNNKKLIEFNSDANLINDLKMDDIKYLIYVFVVSNFVVYFIIKIIKYKLKKLLFLFKSKLCQYIYFNKKIFLISFNLNIILTSLFLTFYLQLIPIAMTMASATIIFLAIKIDQNRF